MRKLILVPTIHAEDERTQLAEDIFNGVFDSNKERVERFQRKITEETTNVWSLIDRGISRLPEDLSGVKVFIEGETKAGELGLNLLTAILGPDPKRGFDRLGKQGRLVSVLKLRGASVEQTEGEFYYEHGKTLDEIDDLVKQIISGSRDLNADKGEDLEIFEGWIKKLEQLKERDIETGRQRDREIASNINKKLGANETGILFLGLWHDPLKFLDRDIEVEFIDPELEAEFRREHRDDLGHIETESFVDSETKG